MARVWRCWTGTRFVVRSKLRTPTRRMINEDYSLRTSPGPAGSRASASLILLVESVRVVHFREVPSSRYVTQHLTHHFPDLPHPQGIYSLELLPKKLLSWLSSGGRSIRSNNLHRISMTQEEHEAQKHRAYKYRTLESLESPHLTTYSPFVSF